MSRWTTRLRQIAVTTLVSAVVLVAMLEITFRFTPLGESLVRGDGALAQPRHLVIREWTAGTTFAFAPPRIRRDNPGGEVLDVYEIATDEAGFIRPGRTHPDPDLTIAFVGGSTTECMYVQPELRFPYLTGRLLEERLGLRVNTLNAGKSGNTTMHSTLQLVGKIIPEAPDIVVIMNNVNDAGVLGGQKTYWNSHSDHRIVARPDGSVERGVRLLRDAVVPYTYRALKRARNRLTSWVRAAHAGERAEGGEAAADDAEATSQIGLSYQRAMTQFVTTAQAWGIRTVVLSQPALNEGQWKPGDDARADYVGMARQRAGIPFSDFRNQHDYFNALAGQVAARHGAAFVDLADSRAWTSRDLYDGLHFTDAGSRHVAEAVASRIAELLDRPPAP